MRFILTKWYVNLIEGIYLNKQELGFILTKWYVNGNNLVFVGARLFCFILTKWYVNILSQSGLTIILVAFYIN